MTLSRSALFSLLLTAVALGGATLPLRSLADSNDAAASTAVQTDSAQPVEASAPQHSQQRGQLPLEELRNFAEVFERIRGAYVEEVDDETLFGYAINGMLTSLDPHSIYLQPDDFSHLRESTSGKFGGLGLEVGQEEGLIRVISPIDDTPAERAGIQAGDLIVTLDGEAVMGMSLSDAIEKMRGEPGSEITLEIRRNKDPELLSYTLTRDEIKSRSVRAKLLSDAIGYVRITQFQDQTGDELNKALQDWQGDALNGVILDLRNNPGGVLNAAVDVSNAFLNDGLIVYTEGRDPSSELKFSANSQTRMPDMPLIVLINGGSASASEIVAGALQDHHRAVVVGTQSFGKGSVQTILPLANDKAIKLTTARYFTPNGRSIQAKGITPDIRVEQSDVTPIASRRTFKEADLRGHLSNPSKQANPSADTKTPTESSTAATENGDTGLTTNDLLERDFQLYEAHTLLRGMSILGARKHNTPQTNES